MRHLLTVVLPAYNGETYIEETIQSILAQSFTDFELLILDDGSTDGTLERVVRFSDPRIRVHRNEVNLGLPSNMNIGIALAQGRFLARVDQDDLARVDRFEQQVTFLQGHADITVVGSQVEHFDQQAPIIVSTLPLDDQTIKARFVSGTDYFANQASMGRVDFYRAHRLHFDPSLYVVDDLGFWFDCMLAGARFANLPDPLTHYRVHRGMTFMNLDVQRLDKSKERLYRRLLPAFFPMIDGDDCEQLLTFYRFHQPAARSMAEIAHLHRSVGRAVRRVDGRWGQSVPVSGNALLDCLNAARDASIVVGTITVEQSSELYVLFNNALHGAPLDNDERTRDYT